MKTILSFLIAILTLTSTAFSQNNTLSGHVTYSNSAASPMHDSTAVYLMQGTALIRQTQVDSLGAFLFENVPAGVYLLKSVTTKVQGGINAVDCIGVLRNFAHYPPLLTGLQIVAADVNASGGTSGSADALMIARRFIGMIPNFMPPNVAQPGGPDWVSEKFTLQIEENSVYTQDIRMLCSGDINGSFIPY